MAETLSSLNQQIKNLTHSIVKWFSNIFKLFRLELQLTIRSILFIVAMVVLIIVFSLCIWFSLMGAFVLWLISIGLKSYFAFLILAVIHFLGICLLFLFIKLQVKNVGFRATRKQLLGVVDKSLN